MDSNWNMWPFLQCSSPYLRPAYTWHIYKESIDTAKYWYNHWSLLHHCFKLLRLINAKLLLPCRVLFNLFLRMKFIRIMARFCNSHSLHTKWPKMYMCLWRLEYFCERMYSGCEVCSHERFLYIQVYNVVKIGRGTALYGIVY